MNSRSTPACSQTLRLSTLALAAALTACGGGGGGGDSTATPPVVPPVKPPVTGPSDADFALQTQVPAATYAAGTVEAQSFAYINERRGACGFGLLAQNRHLDDSAGNHGKYIIHRWREGNYAQNVPHMEVEGLSGFTGKTVTDRQKASGYSSSDARGYGGQVINEGGGLRNSEWIRGLIAAPYHLMSLFQGRRDVGMAFAENSDGFSTLTIDMGYQSHPQRKDAVRTFPCEGTTDVGTHLGAESPNPVAPHGLDMAKVGPGIFVSGPYLKKLTVVSVTLTPQGAAQPTFTTGVNMLVLSQGNDAYIKGWGDEKMNEAVLVPHTALTSNTSYTVNMTVSVAGVQSTSQFEFKTGGR